MVEGPKRWRNGLKQDRLNGGRTRDMEEWFEAGPVGWWKDQRYGGLVGSRTGYTVKES